MATHLRPGETFAGIFRVEAPLSAGGMGAVYKAVHIPTGRMRALKLMLPELTRDVRFLERFQQEATVGARIASEHIVEVIDAGVDKASGTPWLAMDRRCRCPDGSATRDAASTRRAALRP